MAAVPINKKEKNIIIKIYDTIAQIEHALSTHTQNENSALNTSILGRIAISETENLKFKASIEKEKQRWHSMLPSNGPFQYYNTPEIGILFSVGPIFKILSNRVNSKAIAELSNGIYGVLRGLGASEFQATTYIRALQNDRYILIQRESLNDIDNNYFSTLYEG